MNKWIAGLCVGIAVIFMVRIENQLEDIQAQVQDLNQIVKTNQGISLTAADVDCMTKNIYYEAGVEDKVGKYAVGHITMNRLKTGYWGKSVCDVIYSKDQFSWTRLKKLPKPDLEKWNESMFIARDVLQGYRVASLGNGLFYHADYIKDPHWVDHRHKITQIGRHIFYNRAKNSWLEL